MDKECRKTPVDIPQVSDSTSYACKFVLMLYPLYQPAIQVVKYLTQFTSSKVFNIDIQYLTSLYCKYGTNNRIQSVFIITHLPPLSAPSRRIMPLVVIFFNCQATPSLVIPKNSAISI